MHTARRGGCSMDLHRLGLTRGRSIPIQLKRSDLQAKPPRIFPDPPPAPHAAFAAYPRWSRGVAAEGNLIIACHSTLAHQDGDLRRGCVRLSCLVLALTYLSHRAHSSPSKSMSSTAMKYGRQERVRCTSFHKKVSSFDLNPAENQPFKVIVF